MANNATFFSPDCPQTSRDVEELTRFLDESVEAGTEGLIVKTVEGEQCSLSWRERRGAWSHCATPGVGRRGRAASACLPRRWLADRRSAYPQLAASALPCSDSCKPSQAPVCSPSLCCIAVLPAYLVVVCLPCPALLRLVRALQALLPLAEAEEGLSGGGAGAALQLFVSVVECFVWAAAAGSS